MSTLRNRCISIFALCAIALALTGQSLAGEVSAPAAEYPGPSPDGTRLVYVFNGAGSRDLWIANASGANAAILTPWPDSDERHPAWAPNGSLIVFSSNRGAAKHNIWVINPDGTNAIQLTSDDAEHEQPQYSPDGLSILYVSNSTGKRELWVMNANGSGQHSIALITARVSDPAWSPDGNKIVYVGCRRGGACNLFLINANGSGGEQLTNGDVQDWNPTWGVPGILFASNRGGGQGLWLIQPNASGLQQITAPEGVADLDPRWVGGSSGFVFSRSGKTIADAASDIWSVASLGSAAQQVTAVGGPFSIKQAVLSDLIALRTSVTDSEDGQKLDEAISHLALSVDSSLWLDSSRLQIKGGERVFTEEKNAVNKLRVLLEDKHSTIDKALLRGFIERLVMADHVIAQVAIADVIERTGNPTDIAKANEELEVGDSEASKNKPVSAIEHYRNAWKHAVKV